MPFTEVILGQRKKVSIPKVDAAASFNITGTALNPVDQEEPKTIFGQVYLVSAEKKKTASATTTTAELNESPTKRNIFNTILYLYYIMLINHT